MCLDDSVDNVQGLVILPNLICQFKVLKINVFSTHELFRFFAKRKAEVEMTFLKPS